jgi:H+/Cl- antiporter ClcA
MLLRNGENLWKLMLGVAIAASFVYMGIAQVIAPDRFIRRTSVRKGGELLTDFNRVGFQIVGIVVACFGSFILYILAKAILAR